MQNAAREAAVFDEVGEGGFAAQDFELVEQIGQLSWVSSRLYCNSVSLWCLNQLSEAFLLHAGHRDAVQ